MLMQVSSNRNDALENQLIPCNLVWFSASHDVDVFHRRHQGEILVHRLKVHGCCGGAIGYPLGEEVHEVPQSGPSLTLPSNGARSIGRSAGRGRTSVGSFFLTPYGSRSISGSVECLQRFHEASVAHRNDRIVYPL